MNVYIKLNNSTGIDSDNFSLSSAVTITGGTTFLYSGISRSVLVSAGYTLTNVPDNANFIKVWPNTSTCDINDAIFIPILDN